MTTVTIPNRAVTLRPETFRRLQELAAITEQDVSELADEILTQNLDEEDELHEQQEQRIADGVCMDCGDEDCPGGC